MSVRTAVADPIILNLDTDQEFCPNLDPDPGLCSLSILKKKKKLRISLERNNTGTVFSKNF